MAAVSGLGVSAAHAESTWPSKIALTSDVAAPGELIRFTGTGPADVGSGLCVVEINQVVDVTAACEWDTDGGITGDFTVPAGAETGSVVDVSVCWPGCYDDEIVLVPAPYWQANAEVGVLARPIGVPDVTCLTVKQARSRVAETGLTPISRGRPDQVVTEQEPLPGEELFPTVPVTLIAGDVVVPEVVAMDFSDAGAALAERCLRIESTSNVTGGSVVEQDPEGADQVPGGTAVRVTMSGITPEPPPAPTPDPVSSPLRPVLVASGLLLLLLAAASLLATRLTRGRRDLAWLGQHVNVATRRGGPPVSATRAVPDTEQDHVITVVGQEVRRATTVEEEP